MAAFVSELKGRPGRNIWLVGGGEIGAECVRHDLIEEFLVFIHPIILGAGIPLFPSGLPERPLQCVGVERLGRDSSKSHIDGLYTGEGTGEG
jgi:dihydrofolate reductase